MNTTDPPAGASGSPQWQIEATRRLEIPETMQTSHGFAPGGRADCLVKSTIFAGNAARLYGIRVRTALGDITRDKIAAIKAEYVAAGGMQGNACYGYVHQG